MAPKGYYTVVHPDQPADGRAKSVSTPGSPNYNPDSSHYDSTLDPSSPNYIPPAVTSDTGAQVHDHAEDKVNTEDDKTGADWWGLRALINRFNHNGRVQDQYSQEMDAQAKALAAQGGATRNGPVSSCYNYMSLPHKNLKDMVTKDANPGDVGTSGDQWISAGNAMVQFQNDVRTAINNSEADWQGAAGNSARGFMADVGTWVGTAGTQAQLAGTQTGRQGAALSTAKETMPDEVPYDSNKVMQDFNNADNIFDKIKIAAQAQVDYQASQQAHQRAAEVVSTYDSNLAGASTMPAFGAPPTMDGGTV